MTLSQITYPLSDCISLYGGGTPSKDNPDYWNGTIPWASVKDLKTRKLNSTQDSISELGLNNSSSKMVKAGSIIIATRMAVGRVTIAGVDVAINQDLKAIICLENVDVKYLFYFLFSQENNFNKVASGATVKGIKINHILDMKIPLPPLVEQKKIVEILDAADNLRQKGQQLIEHYTTLSQSLFMEIFGDPVTNPKGWDYVPLTNLVTKLGDGLHGTPIYSEDGEYYFINGNNLNHGVIEYTSRTKKIAKNEYVKHKKELNSTTMMVSINGTIGKVAFYNGEKIILGKSACYFNVNESLINKHYLFRLIETPYFIRYALGKSTGSTIKNVSLKTMRGFPVLMPPLAIQNEFIERIENIEKQKQQAQANLKKSEALFNSLLQRAFKGELTENKAA